MKLTSELFDRLLFSFQPKQNSCRNISFLGTCLKTLTRSFAFILYALIIGLLAGCGGLLSSGGQVSPKVTIEWPQLTRAVSAPTYAGSAHISLQSAAESKTFDWLVDRPDGSAAQAITYNGPSPAKGGPGQLHVEFYTGAGGTGDLIASAAASIIIGPDGTLLNSAGGSLGTVSYDSKLNYLAIHVYEVQIGLPKLVVVSGAGPNGLIAISQDLVSLEITENPQYATLNGKAITGTAEGTSQLTATFESISGTASFYVTPRPADFQHYPNFVPNRLAWDSLHSKLWGTFGPGPLFANSIVDFDPVTGAMGTPIPVGSNPSEIAISSDGTTAYIGLNGSSSIRRVDLVSRIAGEITDLRFNSDPIYVTGLDINPTNSNEVAVCVQSLSSSGFGGPFVYRNGVQVGADPEVYTSTSVFYTSGTSLIGIQENVTSGNLYLINVTANSVDIVQTVSSGFSFNGLNSLSGENLVTSSGYVFDTSNLAQVGRVSYDQEDMFTAATDSAHNIAWGVFSSSSHNSDHLRIRALDLSTFAPIDGTTISITTYRGIKRWGTNGLVIFGPDGLYIISDAPGL